MLEKLDAMVKKLDTLDIGLLKLAVLVATIILIKIVPQLLDIGFVPLLVLFIAFAAKPGYSIWGKK
jgi:hypothetical protein